MGESPTIEIVALPSGSFWVTCKSKSKYGRCNVSYGQCSDWTKIGTWIQDHIDRIHKEDK